MCIGFWDPFQSDKFIEFLDAPNFIFPNHTHISIFEIIFYVHKMVPNRNTNSQFFSYIHVWYEHSLWFMAVIFFFCLFLALFDKFFVSKEKIYAKFKEVLLTLEVCYSLFQSVRCQLLLSCGITKALCWELQYSIDMVVPVCPIFINMRLREFFGRFCWISASILADFQTFVISVNWEQETSNVVLEKSLKF